jgi:hypothetical protein
MADKSISVLLRNRAITGVIQAAILFTLLWVISLFQDNPASVEAFHNAAFLSIIATAGYAADKCFSIAENTELGKKLYNAGTAVSMLIAGFGLWLTLAAFNEFRVWPGKIALILLCGITGTAISRLAAYRGKREGGLWWGLIGWLEDKPALKFLFSVLAGIYLVYLRPYLTVDPDMLMLIEWFLLCILGLVIFIRAWSGMSHGYEDEEAGKNWHKHQPRIETLIGSRHDYLVRVERQFLNTGEAMGLYVLLVWLLQDNNIGEEDIVEAAGPLIDFSGLNEIRQSNLTMSRRVRKQEIKRRKDALRASFAFVNSLGQLNRSAMLRRNNTVTVTRTESFRKEIGLDELWRRYVNTGDRAELYVRLIILLRLAGRYQERIISILRSVTEDNGNPSTLPMKSLINELEGAAVSNE